MPPIGRAGASRAFGRRLLGTVVSNEPLGSLVEMTVQVPGWPGARPGQFVMLQAEPSGCYLARPLSVSNQAGETVAVLVAPIGDGTRELCSLVRGDPVWVVGPLGNGFDVETLSRSGSRIVIVGGGVGIAPFPLLLSELALCYQAVAGSGPRGGQLGGFERPLPEVLVLLGFRDAQQAMSGSVVSASMRRLQGAGSNCRLETAVEDGSQGPAARVTDLLERTALPGDQVVVCGPWAMSEAVWGICRSIAGARAWFSLETFMACGVGSCHGCVVALADGTFARVCHEGPVFAGEDVFHA